MAKSERISKQRIFMLRHGKPEFPDGRSYIYGHTDYPLSDDGRAQAVRAGEALAAVRFDRVISSDLARAIQTAEIVVSHRIEGRCGIELDPSLREINMGEWDGLPKEAIKESYTDIFRMRGEDIVNIAAPGGETFLELQTRAVTAFERIIDSSAGVENILLVAHGGLFWSIISKFFDIPLADMFRFGLDFCSLHLVGYSADSKQPWGKFRLLRYNWSRDLTDCMDDTA